MGNAYRMIWFCVKACLNAID